MTAQSSPLDLVWAVPLSSNHTPHLAHLLVFKSGVTHRLCKRSLIVVFENSLIVDSDRYEWKCKLCRLTKARLIPDAYIVQACLPDLITSAQVSAARSVHEKSST